MTELVVNWGVLGPGTIAKSFAAGLQQTVRGRLVAIGARSPGKPGLAESFPGARIHSGYEALLADPEVDAIYVATPHPYHAEWALKAVEAGKHVLSEKPMGLTSFEGPTPCSTQRARPARSWAKHSSTGCTRRH